MRVLNKTVSRRSEISEATEAVGRCVESLAKGHGASICPLICEELLLRLLKAGYAVEVAVRAHRLPFAAPYVELRARGPQDSLTPSAEKEEPDPIEREINQNILDQYQGQIEFRYRKGINRYRVYFEAREPDMAEEIYAFYQRPDAAARSARSPLAVLAHIAGTHRGRVALSFVLQSVKHLAALMIPVFAANMIEAMTLHKGLLSPAILWNILASVTALAVNLICASLYNSVYQRFTRSVETGFKMAIVQKLQTLSMKYHAHAQSGAVLSKLISDVQFIKMLIYEHLITLTFLFWDILFVIAASLAKCPVMLLFYLIAIPIAGLLIRRSMIPINERKVYFRKKTEGSNAAFKEMLSLGILTRSQGLQGTESRVLSSGLRGVQSAANRYDQAQLRLNNVGYGASQLSRLLCLCCALFLAERGLITIGAVVLFQSVFEMIIASVQRVLDAMPQITQGYDSLVSVNEILLERDVEKNGTKYLPTPIRGEIEFRDVAFGYEADKPLVLDGISFRVPAGKCAAFVGRSGTGKTTILNLLLGLYSKQRGQILIDGLDVDELDKNRYRRHIAVVPQNTVLFSGTLWDNLVYGLKYVTTAQVLDALRSVGLDGLLRALPDGLDSPVSEGGANLSGGQRQRVAIARALLREPQIVVFDEITSALDAESEQQVQEAVESLMGRCTMVMVAHRISTLRKADLIYRISEGRAVPYNSFEQVMADVGS